ncbi:MAG: hypothetical protein AAGE89_07840 [Pseudomonadota bacterium]
MDSGEGDQDTFDGFDPSVDILVGLVAVVLLATILFLPLADLSERRATTARAVSETLTQDLNLTFEGNPTALFLASADGIEILPRRDDAPPIGLDDILDANVLVARLNDARESQEHPVIFIGERGQEAVFLMERLLERAALERFSRIYLDESCDYLSDTFKPSGCVSLIGGRGGE